MKNDFNKIKETTSLKASEKKEVFSSVEAFMKMHPIKKPLTTSPYAKHWSVFQKFSLAAFAAVILVGGSTSISAENAQPGDILYPIKINVNEKVFETLSFTEESKIQTHIDLAERRIAEIQQAAEEKTAEPEEIDVAVDSLIEHNEQALSGIEEVSNDGNLDSSKDLLEDLESVLEGYDLATSTEQQAGLTDVQPILDEHIDTIEDQIQDINEQQNEDATSTTKSTD